MAEREACERRVYRLATLLTGNPVAATTVIGEVVDAQPDLRRLDSAHLDRLTVLRSREIPAATLVDDRVPGSIAAALAALSPQQREAWIFARVYRIDPREMARAMDCSVTATAAHLERAVSEFARRGGDPGEAAETLLRYSLELDVPPFHRARMRRRRLQRRVVAAAVILAAAAAVVLVVRAIRPA
jgi:hypothetical protein